MVAARMKRLPWLLGLVTVGGLVVVSQLRAEPGADDRVTGEIVVTDAQSGAPVSQAHLTFQFTEPGSKFRLKKSHPIALSDKTNVHGKCKLQDIPKGTARLMVTADQHEAFGKDFEIEKDNQVIEVKLKKPQPQI